MEKYRIVMQDKQKKVSDEQARAKGIDSSKENVHSIQISRQILLLQLSCEWTNHTERGWKEEVIDEE